MFPCVEMGVMKRKLQINPTYIGALIVDATPLACRVIIAARTIASVQKKRFFC